jgi:hypothetical protein
MMSPTLAWVRRRATAGNRTPALAGPASPLSTWRRGLQIALGLIWLLDAALQYQPYMFTGAFGREVIAPTAEGSPALVADPVSWSARLIGAHPAAWNAVFATIQLLLAVGLLWRPTVRPALAASVAWALGVWWLGEGAGGMLAGGGSPFDGAPGAALLYVLLAILLWPARENRDRDAAPGASVATAGPLGAVAPRVVWALLWSGLGYLALQPANRAAGSVSALLTDMKDGEPGWVTAMDNGLAQALAGHGTAVAITLAILCTAAVIAIALPPPLTRIGVIAAAAAGVVIWVAQDFGEIFTGQGTDPNSGLLLIVLAAAFWPLATRQPAQPGGTQSAGDHVGAIAEPAATAATPGSEHAESAS